MISLAPGTKVFLACRPIDLRAGFNGLAAKVQQLIGQMAVLVEAMDWRRTIAPEPPSQPMLV